MRRPIAGPAAGLLAAALFLAGCSGDDPGDGPPATSAEDTTSTDGTSTDGAVGTGGGTAATTDPETGPAGMPADLDARLAELDALEWESLGSASATPTGASAEVTVDVLRVTRHDGGLDLVLKVVPQQDENEGDFRESFSADGESSEIDGVRLVSGDAYVDPTVYRMDPEKWDLERYRCLCSSLPNVLTPEGFVLRASYRDFDEPVDSVDVEVPGFDPITDIPVQ